MNDLLALVLYAAFAVIAFGWRTWLQWRRTGDTGLRLQARSGTLQWWAKLGFVVALAAGATAPVVGLLGITDPIPALDSTPLHVAATGLACLGIAATAYAQWQMGGSWRIGVDQAERTQLVTNGVFGHVRNPIFTAMVITAAGLALLASNAMALLALVALITALQVQVRFVEEPYLRAVHGRAYAVYSARAGRFLPLVGRDPLPGTEPDAPAPTASS